MKILLGKIRINISSNDDDVNSWFNSELEAFSTSDEPEYNIYFISKGNISVDEYIELKDEFDTSFLNEKETYKIKNALYNLEFNVIEKVIKCHHYIFDNDKKKTFLYILKFIILLLNKHKSQWLVHSAIVYYGENRGILFTGLPESGKSTISRILDESGKFKVLNDELNIIYLDDSKIICSSFPLCYDDNSWNPNSKIYLERIYFLKKSNNNYISKPKIDEEIKDVIDSLQKIDFEDSKKDILRFYKALNDNNIIMQNIHFKKDSSIVDFIENELRNKD